MAVPDRFASLKHPNYKSNCVEAIARFLDEIWDYSSSYHTFIYTRRAGTKQFKCHPFNGERLARLLKLFKRLPIADYDYYFCPNAFSGPQTLKRLAIPTRLAWADIDDADPKAFRPKPNVLWETSAGRFQGLWMWKDVHTVRDAELYSRNLWKLYGGDKGAWSVNKLLRIPGTKNHKPDRHGEPVRLIRFDDSPKHVPESIAAPFDYQPASAPTTVAHAPSFNPYKVMSRYRRRLGLMAGSLMTAPRIMRSDRSGAVYMIVAALVEAGAANDEIVAVLLVNAYFTSKWGTSVEEAYRQVARIRALSEAS